MIAGIFVESLVDLTLNVKCKKKLVIQPFTMSCFNFNAKFKIINMRCDISLQYDLCQVMSQ